MALSRPKSGFESRYRYQASLIVAFSHSGYVSGLRKRGFSCVLSIRPISGGKNGPDSATKSNAVYPHQPGWKTPLRASPFTESASLRSEGQLPPLSSRTPEGGGVLICLLVLERSIPSRGPDRLPPGCTRQGQVDLFWATAHRERTRAVC